MSAETVPLEGYVQISEAEMAEKLDAFRAHMAKRRTIRDFSDQPVPRELIETAILTAGTAPSGANFQPWHFVAISNPEMKTAIREAAEEEEPFTVAAPLMNGSMRLRHWARMITNRFSKPRRG